MEIKIRNATLSDIPILLDFARTVGRFISEDEMRTFLQVDPEAIFVAEMIPDGRIIGSCCGTRLNQELGFLGLYVVLEEYRGRGIGFQLWRAAKEHLGNRNIGVHGNPVNFKKYTEKEGFSHVEDYVVVYHECYGDSIPTNIVSKSDIKVATYFEGHLIGCSNKLNKNVSSADKCTTHKGSREEESESNATCAEMNVMKVVPSLEKSSFEERKYNSDELSCTEYIDEPLPSSDKIEDASTNSAHDELSSVENQIKPNIEMSKLISEFQETPFNSMNLSVEKNSKAEDILSQVVAFDKSVHNHDRSFVVRQTFSWSSCLSKVALLGNNVVGYACLRHVVTEHWIIAPFYADTEEVAEILLFELLQGFDFSQAPKGIILRFPDKNIACQRLVEKFGFKENAHRILTGFTKQCVNTDTSKVYSFHSSVFCCE